MINEGEYFIFDAKKHVFKRISEKNKKFLL